MQSKYFTVMSLAVLTMSMISCGNVIYSDEDECFEGLELQFVYDYNMEWADAFSSKVDCLTVLVYDENGKLVTSKEETSEILHNADYRMVFDLPEGRYHVAAYGGIACDEASFRFDESPLSIFKDDRTMTMCTMKETPEGLVSDCLLHDLFHGTLDVDVAGYGWTYTRAKVEMMKNTNHFRILLQQSDGQPIKSDDFKLSLTDDNTHFAADNSLLPSTAVSYNPWHQGESSVGVNASGEDWSVAYYELSTSRLTDRDEVLRGGGAPSGTSSVEIPRLHISNAVTGDIIADIPLIRYLLLMKSERYATISNQEFLDRQSEWNIVLFLDKDMQWIKTQIVVNDWVVRINDTNL